LTAHGCLLAKLRSNSTPSPQETGEKNVTDATTGGTPKLNAALLEAQKNFPLIAKDKVNPAFSNALRKATYAGLPDVLDALVPALNAQGIVFSQESDNDAHGVAVITKLLHVSGEERSSRFWCPVVKADPQGYGSATTYARRFGACAMCGVSPDDDDDGNSHMKPAEAHDPAAEAAKKERAAGIAKLIAAFAAEGVTSAELAKQLGHPVETVTNDEWTALRALFKEMKAKKPDDEAAKAEKGIRAELDAKFKTFIERIKSAKTEAEIVLLQAEAVKANFPKPDLTALNRTAKDHIGLLAQKKAQPSGEDVPF
jgi:hypothetical protein